MSKKVSLPVHTFAMTRASKAASCFFPMNPFVCPRQAADRRTNERRNERTNINLLFTRHFLSSLNRPCSTMKQEDECKYLHLQSFVVSLRPFSQDSSGQSSCKICQLFISRIRFFTLSCPFPNIPPLSAHLELCLFYFSDANYPLSWP